MALTLRQLGERRNMWLFDTFEGLPAPSADDPDYEIAELFTGSCLGPLEEVRELFRDQGIADGVQFVKDLFQDTIPRTPIQQIAFLHIDRFVWTRCTTRSFLGASSNLMITDTGRAPARRWMNS
jgi:hypothetical protein